MKIEFTWACVTFNAPWNWIKFTARLKWKLFLFWNYVNLYLVYMYLYKNLCVLVQCTVHCIKMLIRTRGKKNSLEQERNSPLFLNTNWAFHFWIQIRWIGFIHKWISFNTLLLWAFTWKTFLWFAEEEIRTESNQNYYIHKMLMIFRLRKKKNCLYILFHIFRQEKDRMNITCCEWL